MTEYYNLPVLYTEEERQRYRAWGIKKEKTLMPFAFVVIVIDVLVLLATVLYLFGVRSREPYFSTFLSAWGGVVGDVAYAVMVLATILVVKPMDWIFDRIFQKPQDPKTLRLEPREDGVVYTVSCREKMLQQGRFSWEEWNRAVNSETNQVYIEGQWLTIGANTIESIYPEGKRGRWMDRPEEKIDGTINLATIQRNLEGYRASLEEKKKEMEWVKRHAFDSNMEQK